MRETIVGMQPCPHCATKMDRVVDVNGQRRPIPGDITLCIACDGVCVFDENLALIAVSAEAIAKFPEEQLNSIASAKRRAAEVRMDASIHRMVGELLGLDP